MARPPEEVITEMTELFQEYLATEGCGCCECEGHYEARKKICELLGIEE